MSDFPGYARAQAAYDNMDPPGFFDDVEAPNEDAARADVVERYCRNFDYVTGWLECVAEGEPAEALIATILTSTDPASVYAACLALRREYLTFHAVEIAGEIATELEAEHA